MHTSFRGAKSCQIRKKRWVSVIFTSLGMDMMDKLRKSIYKHIFRVYSHTCKIHA